MEDNKAVAHINTSAQKQATMKKKREVTDREVKTKLEKVKEVARNHRSAVAMMATKGQPPKVTLPKFSWDKDGE
jgi:hypothetical protein